MMRYENLLEPYPDRLIKSRTVGGGRKEDYVNHADVIQRLTMENGGPVAWSVESVNYYPTGHGSTTREDGVWVCVGHLHVTIDDTPGTFGGVGEGNTAKAAESDAYKRAARLITGIHLWTDSYWLPQRPNREVPDAT